MGRGNREGEGEYMTGRAMRDGQGYRQGEETYGTRRSSS